MPRISVSDRLDSALRLHNIPAETHRGIMNAMFTPNSSHAKSVKQSMRIENAWKTLIDEVRAVVRGLMSNRYKQHEDIRPLYDQYIDLVRQARDDITAASMLTIKDKADPNGPKVAATPEDVKRMAANRNRKLGIDGPTCTSRWHTWVAPADRKALRDAFETAYAKAQRGAGKRVTPFLTSDVTQHNKTRMEVLTNFIAAQRRALAVSDPLMGLDLDRPYSHIPHHALHLCALRMAELNLHRWKTAIAKDKYHGLDNPLPVQWTHLLDHDMRERLRAGDENPASVTIAGLESFYRDDGSARAQIPETPEQIAANKANGWD